MQEVNLGSRSMGDRAASLRMEGQRGGALEGVMLLLQLLWALGAAQPLPSTSKFAY